MKCPVNYVVSSLMGFQRWFAKMPKWQKLDASSTIRVADTVTGCLDVLDYAPTTNKDAWIARRPERALLFEPRVAMRSENGRKAIRNLVDLVISELEAARPFRPVVEVGVLPVKEPRKLTVAHLEALRAGHNQHRLSKAHQRKLAFTHFAKKGELEVPCV